MRARKRNPYWGQGLDKRQARRVRRRGARKVRAVARVSEAAGFHLEPWQESLVERIYAGRTLGGQPSDARRFWLDRWVVATPNQAGRR